MTSAPGVLDDAERLAWLQLSRSDGIGPLTFASLLQRFGTAVAAIERLSKFDQRGGRPISLASRDEASRELEAAARLGLTLLVLAEPVYPAALRAIAGAPPVLMVAGDPTILQRPAIAIVGARNASGAGLLFTERLARDLGAGGLVVVSGLARGIDARAHKATLATGTVAVLAGGHDRVYPPEHKDLARQIAAAGAVVSEMPLTWEPRARDFPRRNRIVSGLSLGAVVVEAALRSGSLITARLANEQGRDVFAVPGSPLDPRAEGSNGLLRQCAILCTGAADVFDAIGPSLDQPRVRSAPGRLRDGPPVDLRDLFGDDMPDQAEAEHFTDDRTGQITDRECIFNLLGPVPTGLDELVQLSGLGAGRVRAVLTDLHVSGHIEDLDGYRVSRVLSTEHRAKT